MNEVPALTVLIKPASGNCNLRCRYCFYADEMKHRERSSYGQMSLETAEQLICKSIQRTRQNLTFAFQGGEPTLAGLDFYREFVRLVQKYGRPGLNIQYSLQTNGMLMDNEWARFLHENHFLVGLSLDGPRKIHDLYRVRQDGSGSWNRVLLASQLMKEYKVDFNILTVVTSRNAGKIREIYRFYQENKLHYQQYIPCIDPFGDGKGDCEYSLAAQEYGRFLIDLFDLWYEDIIHRRFIYIRMFENLCGMLRGLPPESCGMGGVCGMQYVFEADGSVYPCDFYALDEWKLGNIREQSYEKLDRKRTELRFIENSCRQPEKCRVCQWYSLCRNGCRRDRVTDLNGQPGINSYCEGYQAFFEAGYPRLARLAEGGGKE